MRRRATVISALAVTGLAAALGLAQRLILEQKAEYPAEWGTNVASAAAGGKVVSESRSQGQDLGAENLLDGDVMPDRPSWTVEAPRRGRPSGFAVTEGHHVREVRVCFSAEGQTFGKVRTLSLRSRPGMQGFEMTPPEPARPALKETIVILSSIETVPGMRITRLLGLVQGSTVRAKHVGKDIMAGFKNIVGGEIKGYTELLAESRNQALQRMIEQAEQLGGNAVVNVRFATSSVMQGAAELLAYGTAVTIEPEG